MTKGVLEQGCVHPLQCDDSLRKAQMCPFGSVSCPTVPGGCHLPAGCPKGHNTAQLGVSMTDPLTAETPGCFTSNVSNARDERGCRAPKP